MNATRKSWIHGVCVGFVASLVATYIVKKLRSRKLKEKKIVELQEECEESKNIKKEQLVRTTQFFGEEGQKRLDKAFVVVVGVGGVGKENLNSYEFYHFIFVPIGLRKPL
jgi:mannitol-specific phosphotransferase system IIBC component